MNIPNDLITASDARKLLGISFNKMAKLIRDGRVQTFQKPLDGRVKLVSRAEILELLKPQRAEAA